MSPDVVIVAEKHVVMGAERVTLVTAGAQGPAGEDGATGATGATGPGVASGGTTGQLLRKSSNADYATEWYTLDLSSYATTTYVTTGFQPLDSDLTAIAALTTTTFGRSLLTVADAAAGRAALSAAGTGVANEFVGTQTINGLVTITRAGATPALNVGTTGGYSPIQTWSYNGTVGPHVEYFGFVAGANGRPFLKGGFGGGLGLYTDMNIDLAANNHIRWTNFVDSYTNYDTGIKRDSASVLKVTDGSTGTGALMFSPASMSDASAASNTIYYSTTQGKPAWKDAAGVVHPFTFDS